MRFVASSVLTVFVSTILAASFAFGAPTTCETLFSETNLESSALSAQELKQIARWRFDLRKLKESDRHYDRTRVLHQISNLATQLIRDHRNDAFLDLARSIHFPFSRKVYDGVDGFGPYGRDLLEEAILSKNHEVFEILIHKFRAAELVARQPATLATWDQLLTRIVTEDPYFRARVNFIRTRNGSSFEPVKISYGILTPARLAAFQTLEHTKDIQHLYDLLKVLYPPGTIRGFSIDKKGRKTPASLIFEMPYDVGDLNELDTSDRWLQMAIYDSKYATPSWLGGYRYTLVPKFNLQLTRYISANGSIGHGKQVRIQDRELNWIQKVTIQPGTIRIDIQRDKEGARYEQENIRRLSLTLYHNHLGRIEQIEIKNGGFFGSALRFEIPSNTEVIGRVFFEGREDESTQRIQN